MEDLREAREEREDKAESKASGEGINVVLVIISACVLIATVTVAAIFFLHPTNKNNKIEMAWAQDNTHGPTVKTDRNQPQVESKEELTGPDAANPAADPAVNPSVNDTNASPTTATSTHQDENTPTGKTAKQGAQALTYNFGDPNTNADIARSATNDLQVVVEKRDPKTDLPVEKQLASRSTTSTVSQQTKIQPPVQKRTTTAVSSKQQATTRQQPVVKERNVSVATVKQPRTISVREYWVQVASFKSRTRAESLNEQLRQLGYAGTIKTTTIDGETHFRVRLGPYANNNEAEKFRGWLIGIKGLEGSYISQTINKKTIN